MARHDYDFLYDQYMRCQVPYVFTSASYFKDGKIIQHWRRWTVKGSEVVAPYVSENAKDREFGSAKNHPETGMWGHGR